MPVGIVCAMPEEIAALTSIASRVVARPESFHTARLADREVVIACCGLGKVGAAITASLLVERFRCTALVSAGTAGGLGDTEPMQVLIGMTLIQHDYGRSRGLGELDLYRPGVPPLPAYADMQAALTQSASVTTRQRNAVTGLEFVRFGTFASGDLFVNDLPTTRRLESLGADAVDMECAAVAQVADHFGLPWAVAKGISDTASHSSHQDFLAGLTEAATRSAVTVAALLDTLD